MPSRKPSGPALRATAQRFRQAQKELLQLDYFLKGTVSKRMMKCGKPQCACHRDPAQRHGPYFEWTYKAAGKTVNVKLSSPGGAPLPSRHQATPQTQGRSGSLGKTVAHRLSSTGQASQR